MWKYILFLFFFIFFRELYTELIELFSDTREVNHLIFFGVFILVLSTVIFLDVFLFKPYRSNKMKTSISDFLVNNYKSIYETLSYEVLSMATKHNLKNPQKRLRIAYYLKNRILVVLKRDNTKINLRMNNLFNYIISFVLILSFLLWFLNRLIPVGTQQLDLGFMVLKTYGFNDINILIWYLASKAMIIIPLFVWFITCSYWWRFAILSPITLYVFQFWEAFQDTNSLEGWGNARAFPIIFVIIIFLLILSKSVKYKFGVVEMYEYLTDQIEADLEMLVVKDQSLKGKFLEYELLKKQTVTLRNSKTYLNSLLNLKHSLELKLRDKDTDVDR